MNALVEALKSLRKRKVTTILLVLQYTIGFSALFSSANFYNSIHHFSKNFQSVTDTNKTSFMYNSTGIESLSTGGHQPDYNAFYKYIQENNDISNFGTYAYSNKLLTLSTLNFSDRLKLANELYEFNRVPINGLPNNLQDVNVNLLTIDKGLNNFIRFPLDNGEAFTSNDFEKNHDETRNILLGGIFEKYFKLGDVITLQSDKKEQFKIAGFLKSNTYFYNQGGQITGSLINLSSVIIVPINKDEEADKEMFSARIMNGLLLQLKDNANFQDASKKINLKAQELRLSEHNEKLATLLGVIISNFVNANLSQIIIGVFFCVFSSVGLITSLIVTIYTKKREIGVRIAYGASTFNIFNSLFIEIAIISLISYIGAIIEYMIENNGSIQLIKKEYAFLSIIDIYGTIDIYLLIQLLAIVIFTLTIISLIVLKQLKKLQPKDLIGGLE